jgi:hypothetical protein
MIGIADTRISAFVKPEKFDPGAKVNPDPRMIQARNARFNVVIGCFLKPIEHELYRLEAKNDTRSIAKGLNSRQRANLLVDKFSRFLEPVCFSIDGSRWDKHVSREILKVSHDIYRRICPDPVFSWCLDRMLDNKCFTANRVKYRVSGGRMSGDMDTACGNCYLMCLMVDTCMHQLGIRHYDLMDDGDDCLIIVEESDSNNLRDNIARVFLTYGQDVKLENEARTPSDVVFCQSKLVQIGSEYTMVRNWVKVLSQSTAGVRHWGDPRLVGGMLNAVGLCELALSRGVPILQEYALACIRNGDGTVPRAFEDDEQVFRRASLEVPNVWNQKVVGVPIAASSRESFADAWGIPPGQQMEIEAILRQWTISREDYIARNVPPELDNTWNQMKNVDVAVLGARPDQPSGCCGEDLGSPGSNDHPGCNAINFTKTFPSF